MTKAEAGQEQNDRDRKFVNTEACVKILRWLDPRKPLELKEIICVPTVEITVPALAYKILTGREGGSEVLKSLVEV